MAESLDSYIRNRAQQLNLNLSEVCLRANISRQTFYALSEVPTKLPTIQTLISLAEVLKVHPLRLFHLVFDAVPLRQSVRSSKRSDRSAFVADITFPDGTLVLPNQVFTKTWAIQNIGKVAWENRFLQCWDEEILVYSRSGEKLELANNLIPHSQRIPVPFTQPGEVVHICVEFTAPKLPATVLSYWKSVFADGSLCFPKASGLWCKVQVTSITQIAHEER